MAELADAGLVGWLLAAQVPKKLLEKAKEVIEAILLQLQDDKHQAQDIIFHRCACPTIQVNRYFHICLFIFNYFLC
jgi:hypothetical protein